MFAIPSLKDLIERARNQFWTNLPGSDARIWPNNINPTAKVIGGMTHEVFGFADYIQRQKFALTADGENLDMHGEELGLARNTTAPASGPVDIVAPGAMTLDTAAILRRRADGVEYSVVSGGSLSGAGTLTVTVISLADGAAGNAIAGTSLEIVTGLTGDDTTTATVAAGEGIVGGLDVEDDESWRARILFRKRNPPHGGAPSDYVGWCGEVSGVSFYQDRPTVFVERRWLGAGTIRVFPLMFGLYADGVPGSADIARVSNYLQSVQPSGAQVTVAAPTRKVIDIVIDDLLPMTTTEQEAIRTELRAMFPRLARVAGGDMLVGGMPYLATPTSFSRSWIWQTVANTIGEERHGVTTPAADVSLAAGEFPVLGTVTFT